MVEGRLLRSFLALDPPPGIRKEIGIMQDRLKKILPGNIRWVNPDGMHLTLKFFGDISGEQVAAVAAVMGDICAGVTPLALDLQTIGFFPGAKRPRVIWLGIQGDLETLLPLREEIDRELAARGFPKEERPFQPHLTLGRIKSPGPVAGTEHVTARGDEFTAGSFTARELILFKSDLTPRGAVYTALATFPFAG